MNQYQDFQFAFFSANLFQYLPAISWTEHQSLFEKYNEYHLARPIPERWAGTINGFRPIKPGIIATFHLGNHLELPIALVEAGYSFDLLIDQPTYERYHDTLEVANQRLNKMGKEEVKFLLSEDRNLFFKIKDSIRRERHLLIFADGNGGHHGKDGNENLIPVPFFAAHLSVKKGIPVLARLLKVPIYPLLPETKENSQNLKFFDPIFTDFNINKSTHSKLILSHLFHILERQIANDPMKWECWIYIHQNGMLHIHSGLNESDYEPDLTADSIVKLYQNNKVFWFDRKKYLLFRSV